MQDVIKIVKTKNNAYKISMPKDLTDKYAWSKNYVFLVSRYDERILIIEPFLNINCSASFAGDENTSRLFHYLKPLKEAIAYSFYIPLDIIRANNWQNLKLLAVHDSGGEAIIMEAFPNEIRK